MKHTEGLDLDHRPDEYVSDILTGIKGTLRRAMILDYWNEGRLGELEPALLETEGSSNRSLGGLHPMWMGGEYLEDPLPGELMIVRIDLKSTTADAIELRVRPLDDGGLGVRWVDEYETKFVQPCSRIERPFSLGELIEFIESSAQGDMEDGKLPLCYTRWNYDIEGDPRRLENFTSLSSPHYPELEVWFARLSAEWWAEVTALHSHDEED